MADHRVAVIGAGVVGFNTALSLQENLSRCRVDIVADKFMEQITSYGPAGVFRPSPGFSGPDFETTKKWIDESYAFYKTLLENSETIVSETSGYLFSNTNPHLTKNRYLERVLPIYRNATEEEKSYDNVSWKYGSYFRTLMTPGAKLLPWAFKKFRENGGRVIKQNVHNLADLESNYDAIFNCAGLGAKYLCDDYDIVPIRGQLVKVDAPWVRNFYYNDYDTYIFPLGDGKVTLGGTRNYESYDTTVSRHDTASILERCEQVLPGISKAPVVSEWVGLRPHRSKVRVELKKSGRSKIIHNYGHGAYGFTASPGTAKYAVNLLKESHLTASKL